MEEVYRVTSLSKNEQGREILRSLSFSVEKGGIFGILAPKGSGKTALLEILSGADPAFSGTVSLYGQPLTKARPSVGYLPSNSFFYPDMTVEETLDFVGASRGTPPDLRVRQIREAMELFELEPLRRRLVACLSLWESKRLGFAAALLGNPPVVLLDEPFPSSLRKSPAAFEAAQDWVRMLGKRKTVILAESDYATARTLCDRGLLLSSGEIVAKGSFEEMDARLRASSEGLSMEEFYESLVLLAEERSWNENEEEGK